MNVADCLANTGNAPGSMLLLVGFGAVLVGLGILAVRSRKRAGAMLGALAIIGALALVPLAAPSTAHAATGDCTPGSSQPTPDPAPTPAPTPDPTPDPDVTLLTPEAPAYAPQCGAAPVISTPEVEHLTYTVTQEGTVATVTAAVTAGVTGYAIDPNAQSVWTFDMSYTPATVLTAENLAFTYGGWSPTPRIDDAAVAAFLEGQGAPLSFRTASTLDYTYAVFTDTGNQITELGETQQITEWATNYSAVQNGQDVAITYLDSTYVNGFEAAQAVFNDRGGVPEGAYIGIIGGGSFTSDAMLTASYVNECGIAATVTAVMPYVIPPV